MRRRVRGSAAGISRAARHRVLEHRLENASPLGAHGNKVRHERAERLTGILTPPVADESLDQLVGVGGHIRQAGPHGGRVLGVIRRVRDVIRVGGIDGADELSEVGDRTDQSDHGMACEHVRGVLEVFEVGRQPLRWRRHRRGFVGGVVECRCGSGRSLVSGFAGVVEDLDRLVAQLLPGILVGRLGRQRVGVVGDGIVVRIARLHPLIVLPEAFLPLRDGLRGSLLGRFHDGRKRIQRTGRRLGRRRGVAPLRDFLANLLVVGVGGLALKFTDVDSAEPVGRGGEIRGQAIEFACAVAHDAGLTVDEFLRILGFAELLLIRGGAQLIGDTVAPVTDVIGDSLRTDGVESVGDELRSSVHHLADEAFAVLEEILALLQEVIPESHAPST